MGRFTSALVCVITASMLASACYEDEGLGPNAHDGLTSVYLTDAPFPFGLVDRVEVYVVEIAASTQGDTVAEAQDWTVIASPRRRFDLLAVQQGTTVLLGSGDLPARLYRAVRMTINTDSSRIVFTNGSGAAIQWPMPGELVLDAEVDEPLAVPDSGADIVIDLDVGRSFVFGLEGPLYDFLFVPHLRAVNSTATGSLAGRVFGDADDDGIPESLEHASITVFRGNPAEPAYTWRVRATGHTGPDGTYTVGFLNAGTHLVQVDAPFSAGLGSTTTSGIVIIAGRETEYSVTLPSFEAASIEIEGPRTVSVGDSTVLRAIVRDANGVIVPNPSVRWQSLDTGVATVTDIGEYATVRAWAPGVATILLTSLGRTDSIGITVSQ